MRLELPPIRHDNNGFETLVSLYKQCMNCIFETIEIDLKNVSWFDAHMCAAFGAILYRLSQNVNTIKIINIPVKIEEILAKNGFLSHYGRKKIPDTWGTTIPYQRFNVKDDRYFAEYVEKELMSRPEVPKMSLGLQKKFQECIFEIFSNAVLHSKTELGIFSCGQFFPKKHHLDFSVADLGIGICANVNEVTELNLSPENAIIWATSDRNTTKHGQVPGGIGLKLLCEFIDLNRGCLQIVSDAGYWKRENNESIVGRLNYPFPGTIVNLQIRTNDEHSYMLSSELTSSDIF